MKEIQIEMAAGEPMSVGVNALIVNEKPTITSNGGEATASLSVPENSVSVTAVRATDPNFWQTLSYSIIGGRDAALFGIDPKTGVLAFNTAPDFEAPADAQADNVYDVTVQVSDGSGGTDTQAIAVEVTNTIEPGEPGAETIVNTTTQNDQISPAVATLADGGYVVIWLSNLQDGSDWGVYAQRFGADGNALGGETLVNTTTANQQYSPAVAALSDGGYVVTWTSYGDQDGSKAASMPSATMQMETRTAARRASTQLQ